MEKYAFVDMHIHTEWSDENLCDISVEKVLEKAQKKSRESGRDCVIAIADHNTILGSKLAMEILNSKEGKEKYPNVKLISGIEFTTDLCEMRQYFDDKTSFTRCHTLAYDFDVNNRELIAYSKITHKQFSNEDNIGLQICSARRALIEQLGLRLPYSVFESMADLNHKTNFRKEFLDIVDCYLKEHHLKYNIKKIENIISSYIDTSVGYNREASAYGRIWLSELAKMIKDAGGKLVIAHPSILKINKQGMDYIAKKEGIKFEDIYTSSKTKFNNCSDLSHITKQKLVMNYFLDAFEKICGYKVFGIEKNYTSNFKPRLYDELSQLCKERRLFETAGSDYHGEHLHPEKRIANVFSETMQHLVKEGLECSTDSTYPLVVQYVNAVGFLLQKDKNAIENKTVYGIISGAEISNEVFEKLIYTQKPKNNKEKITPIKDNSEKIEYLKNIIERFDKIFEYSNSYKKQAKLLLKLNLYAESICAGLIKMKYQVDNFDFKQDEDYKEIVKLITEIKQKLNKLYNERPKLQKDLKFDMKYYYKKREIAIEQIAKLEFPQKTYIDTDNNCEK